MLNSGFQRHLAPQSLIVRIAMMLTVVLAAALTAVPGQAGEDADLKRIFEQFYDIELDTSRSLPVDNLKIEREGLDLVLASGRLWLAKPLEGMVTGAYFVGDGVATIEANGKVGRRLLEATLSGKNSGVTFPGKIPRASIIRPAIGIDEYSVLEVKVSEVHLRFSDGLDQELAPLLQEGGGESQPAVAGFADRNEKLFNFNGGPNMENEFLVQVKNEIDRYAFFMAELKVGNEWITYGHTGSVSQEVWVGTHEGIGGVQRRAYAWTGFDNEEDYNDAGYWDADLLLDQKALLDITHQEMAIDLPNTQAFSIDAKVTFSPLMEELTVVPFNLLNNLGYDWNDPGGRPVTLHSVQDAAGNDLPFLHTRGTVLVRLPEPLAPGEEAILRFQAEEETIIQISDQSWNIQSTTPWYPQHGYLGGDFTTDWTVSIRKPLIAVASGKLLETREEGGQTITRWAIDHRDVSFPSLIFGRFQSREGEYVSEVTGETVAVGVHANPLGDLRGTGKSKAVLEEAKTIMSLYEQLFGPFPFKRLDITQMAPFSGFGQAPPGILFLTGDAFLPTGLAAEIYNRLGASGSPYYHDFFAHELGHQWFGNAVRWGRWEDVWLSEAFTEYASALYTIQIAGDGKFQEKLKDWKDNAREGEKSGFPIAGAFMVSARDQSVAGKYTTGLIYEKGAYVVHMLRMTLGHEKFIECMQNYQKNYQGRMATTQMFKREVEEVAGGSMDWFFDQWFYKAGGIPKFRFDYNTKKTEDGGYLLTGRILQEEGPNFKQVLMPVFFDLGGKTPSVKQVAVMKPEMEFQFKLPAEPKRVWLDEFKTVLGDVVTGGH